MALFYCPMCGITFEDCEVEGLDQLIDICGPTAQNHPIVSIPYPPDEIQDGHP